LGYRASNPPSQLTHCSVFKYIHWKKHLLDNTRKAITKLQACLQDNNNISLSIEETQKRIERIREVQQDSSQKIKATLKFLEWLQKDLENDYFNPQNK